LPTIYATDEIWEILQVADPYMRIAIEMGLKLGFANRN